MGERLRLDLNQPGVAVAVSPPTSPSGARSTISVPPSRPPPPPQSSPHGPSPLASPTSSSSRAGASPRARSMNAAASGNSTMRDRLSSSLETFRSRLWLHNNGAATTGDGASTTTPVVTPPGSAGRGGSPRTAAGLASVVERTFFGHTESPEDVPTILFSDQHLWYRPADGLVGITEFGIQRIAAQQQRVPGGEVEKMESTVDLRGSVGRFYAQFDPVGSLVCEIEPPAWWPGEVAPATRIRLPISAPVDGTLREWNDDGLRRSVALLASPMSLRSWLFRMQPEKDFRQRSRLRLMNYAQYLRFAGDQAQKSPKRE